MPYEVVLCKVLGVDLDTQSLTLEPLNSPRVETINTSAGSGLKFASSYAPLMNDTDAKTEKISNVPVGKVSYPDPDDIVLALVWMTDMADHNRPRAEMQQHPQMEVIILSRVIWNHPGIGPYDNIIGDKSGARIHLNHGWLDLVNIKDLDPAYTEDQEAARPHQLRTGHVTAVGNRFVRLAGQKFLPFGLFSHLLGQAKTGRKSIVFPASSDPAQDDSGESQGTTWDEVFVKDPTDTDIFDGLLSTGLGSGKFLEPPCPEPGTMMDMHDSGFKHLVEVNGHVREYIPKGKILVVGSGDADDNLKKSFDPKGQNESSAFPEVADGVYEIHCMSGASLFKIKFDATSDILEITTVGGPGTGLVKIIGDLEVTGEVKGGTGKFG